MSIDPLFAPIDSPYNLTHEEEAALTDRARSGDSEAFTALARAFAPRFLAEDNRLRDAIRDPEERRQVIACAFFEAVAASRPGTPVRFVVDATMTRLTTRASTAAHAVSVPASTMDLYQKIVRTAGGDLDEAERIAPEHGMTRETFRDVRRARCAGVSYDALEEQDDAATADADDLATGPRDHRAARALAADVIVDAALATVEAVTLAHQALAALDGTDLAVTRLAYGFDDYDPVPDAEIAHRIGITRAAVWKARTRALRRMRTALGVANPA